MSEIKPQRSPERSIAALTELIQEAKQARNDLREPALTTWKTKVSGVLEGSFGQDSTYWGGFWKVRYTPSVSSERTDFNPYRIAGVAKAVGIIEAAIYQLKLQIEDVTDLPPLESDTDSYDSGLWEHVSTAFEQEQ